MDFGGFVFDPSTVTDYLASGVATGAVVGALLVIVSLVYGRRVH